MTTTGQQHIKHLYHAKHYSRNEEVAGNPRCVECDGIYEDAIHIKPNEISDATLSPELEKRAKQIHDKPHDTELLICALYNALQAERNELKEAVAQLLDARNALADKQGQFELVSQQREEWMRIAAVRESARVQAEADAHAYKQLLTVDVNGNAHIDMLQRRALATAIYPGQGTVAGLIYCVLGLNGEAGEVAEHAKKILRDDNAVITSERRPKIKKELGDAWWYLCGAAREAGFTMLEIANANAEKLSARQQAGTLQGSGSER